ncbi:hypothetical protein EJ110_NYTH57505 [Nymphaea thermarum]|nr:hypothetical protein EJ110_NYTH57505 [Nymphaea thermarum]
MAGFTMMESSCFWNCKLSYNLKGMISAACSSSTEESPADDLAGMVPAADRMNDQKILSIRLSGLETAWFTQREPGSNHPGVMIRSREEDSEEELEAFMPGADVQQVQRSGQCLYGDRCRFAHRDLRYKTKPCRTVLAGKMCPYGHCCLFKHNLTEEEKRLQ